MYIYTFFSCSNSHLYRRECITKIYKSRGGKRNTSRLPAQNGRCSPNWAKHGFFFIFFVQTWITQCERKKNRLHVLCGMTLPSTHCCQSEQYVWSHAFPNPQKSSARLKLANWDVLIHCRMRCLLKTIPWLLTPAVFLGAYWKLCQHRTLESTLKIAWQKICSVKM